MDDGCAVCADNLEWVAYGACGHREVCSKCVARLRFICNDRRCCICKTESSVIFVTKALGDYTRLINDFSVLPYEVREGRVGSYWYHEDTQAFFDDIDHYKMIKAMCKLSCSLCDKMAEPSNDWVKRRGMFRSIEQLRGHLFHQHRLLMCSLCLEGRKVFICEQKLYTKAQLRQHMSTGDSEVDGTEGERCGFTGHPLCEFCKTPFYGDSELYSHMSTQHYTCHICQRQHSGRYEYYKNYDDLEIHFDKYHYLCEDEGCLAKKFVVFPSEAELKRHSTMEHRGRMSRAQRNAALQIPTSFQYRGRNDNHHVRGRIFKREQSDNDHQPSVAIEACLGTSSDPPVSSAAHAACDHGNLRDIDPLVQPFESLSTSDSETSSRYSQALGRSSSAALLQESSFPPLPVGSSTNQHKSKHGSEGLANNTKFANLRRQKNGNLDGLSSAREWPAAIRRPMQASSSSSQVRLTTNVAAVKSWNTGNVAAQSSNASSKQSQPCSRPTRADVVSSGSQMSSSNTSRISHSSSVPNLADSRFSQPSISDFPPVSLVQRQKHSSCSQVQVNVEDVCTANKSLVEKVRSALEYDEVKYSSFKDISAQYRQGSVGTARYLDYVRRYGLSHLVLELARLCPDVQKQKELIEVYNASFQSNGLQEDGSAKGGIWAKENNTSKKGKEILKALDAESSNAKDSFANSVISSVRKLQSSYNPSEEEVEVLSKEGCRPSKGKSKVMIEGPKMEQYSSNQPSLKIGSQNDSTSARVGTEDGGGGSKRRKKTSKFHRVRLGDGSMAALLDLKNSELDPDPLIDKSDSSQNSTGGLPVRGVWKKGGSQNLFS